MNHLRNVSLPPECKVETGILESCVDLGTAFPGGDNRAILDALKQRFNDLPFHKICYYQSYHPADSVLRDLKREDQSLSIKVLGGCATGKQQDCLGMTPLHILACSTKHHLELYKLMVEKYPETLITKDKWGDIPLLYALWCV